MKNIDGIVFGAHANVDEETRFLVKAGLFICLLAAFFNTTYGLFSLYVGHVSTGVANFLLVGITLFTAWRYSKGTYHPLLISLTVLPISTVAIYLEIKNYGLVGGIWAFPTVSAIYAVLKERDAWIANALFAVTAIAAMWFEEPSTENTIRFGSGILVTNLYAIIFKRQLTKYQRNMEKAAVTDSLTGLLNRTWLEKELEKSKQIFERTSLPVSMLIIDIDKFKSINDTHGHMVGDQVIKQVGCYLKENFRASDSCFRHGGEEFLCILYDVDIKCAIAAGNKVINDVRALDILDTQQVTVSIGIAALKKEEAIADWMHRADENLYKAKNNGRNRIAY